MIEIINENRISAEKIFRDLNDDEKSYLLELLVKESASRGAKAVYEATYEMELREKRRLQDDFI